MEENQKRIVSWKPSKEKVYAGGRIVKDCQKLERLSGMRSEQRLLNPQLRCSNILNDYS